MVRAAMDKLKKGKVGEKGALELERILEADFKARKKKMEEGMD